MTEFKKTWITALVEVCNLWIDDIKNNRQDFGIFDISDIDQLIAFEVSAKCNHSDLEYELMSCDADYDLIFEGYKNIIKNL